MWRAFSSQELAQHEQEAQGFYQDNSDRRLIEIYCVLGLPFTDILTKLYVIVLILFAVYLR